MVGTGGGETSGEGAGRAGRGVRSEGGSRVGWIGADYIGGSSTSESGRRNPPSWLPDHLHAIWQLPPGDHDFSTRWRLIKTRFARALPKRERLSAVRAARHERGIWQRRFWEHLIRDEADYARHVEYCYINPLKHGLVTRVRDWPYSSFHRDVRAGLFPDDWAGDGAVNGGDFGER
jgi:REP element-mobilizing transposase RayT